MNVPKICNIKYCERTIKARGWCNRHYMRYRKHGTPLADIKSRESHRLKNTKEYNSWCAMKQRCYYKKSNHSKYYSEKGITVCERWLNSFENFLKDMGRKPEGMSLDRIDNNKGYSPENCRWATNSQQQINKSVYINNKSGVKGVFWDKTNKKWVAQIRRNGRIVWRKYFSDKNNAHVARMEMVNQYDY